MFGHQRLGEYGALAVSPVPGGPQAGGQHRVGVQRQQRRGGLQVRPAGKIAQDLAAAQGGGQGIPGQLGQPGRAAQCLQRIPVRRQQHPGFKGGGGSFQSLQHTKGPFRK